ncbi:MAG TPA: tetratricopeptide repeat protein [Myxococcales bacterium]|jgi:hypothetical protein
MPLAVLLALALTASTSSEPDAGAADADVGEPAFLGAEADPELIAELGRALALRRQGKPLDALEVLDAVRKQALADKHPEIATRALHRRAEVLNALHRGTEAEAAYREAYSQAEKRGDLWTMARAAHDLGAMSSGKSGFEWVGKSLEARRKSKDLDGLRKAAWKFAEESRPREQMKDIVPLYEEAIRAAEELSDTKNVWQMSLEASSVLLENAESTRAPGTLEKGRAFLGKAIVAYDADGHTHDLPTLCANVIARDGSLHKKRSRCEKHWPLDTPLSRWGLHQREADDLASKAKGAMNGFARPSLLVQAARAHLLAASDQRELGPENVTRAEALERQARQFLLSGLANRDASAPLLQLCAADDVRELCQQCGLVKKP